MEQWQYMRWPLTNIDVTPCGWLLNLNIVKNIFMVMGDDGKMLRDVKRSWGCWGYCWRNLKTQGILGNIGEMLGFNRCWATLGRCCVEWEKCQWVRGWNFVILVFPIYSHMFSIGSSWYSPSSQYVCQGCSQ